MTWRREHHSFRIYGKDQKLLEDLINIVKAEYQKIYNKRSVKIDTDVNDGIIYHHFSIDDDSFPQFYSSAKRKMIKDGYHWVRTSKGKLGYIGTVVVIIERQVTDDEFSTRTYKTLIATK